jgi:hypothetical protein
VWGFLFGTPRWQFLAVDCGPENAQHLVTSFAISGPNPQHALRVEARQRVTTLSATTTQLPPLPPLSSFHLT